MIKSLSTQVDELFASYENPIKEKRKVEKTDFHETIRGLIDKYNDRGKADKVLNLELLPEPYYGDPGQCSTVLLTHNPGSSDEENKGLTSEFKRLIYGSTVYSTNYQGIAVTPKFPNKRTNTWYSKINKELNYLLNQTFKNKLFIRDLIPFHSTTFGAIIFLEILPYLYDNFFNQVIKASLKSEYSTNLNSKDSHKKLAIIFARGAAWNGKDGLMAVGWDKVGELLLNATVYKANLDKIIKIYPGLDRELMKDFMDHKVYIIVLTQIGQNQDLGLYLHCTLNDSFLNYYTDINNNKEILDILKLMVA